MFDLRSYPNLKTKKLTSGLCNKHYIPGKQLSGGVFIVRCGIHATPMGFHFIPEMEGLSDFFSFLITRFDLKSLNGIIIVYDYGCGLAGYCWLRAWNIFKRVVFAIDDFHFGSHDCFYGCAYKAFR